jgi:hypothetical protein
MPTARFYSPLVGAIAHPPRSPLPQSLLRARSDRPSKLPPHTFQGRCACPREKLPDLDRIGGISSVPCEARELVLPVGILAVVAIAHKPQP